jgi:DNA processing protein
VQTLSPEQRALLHLHLVSGLGPKLTRQLLDHFSSAQAVLGAAAGELLEVPHIGDKLATDFRRGMDEADVDGELQRMAEFDVRIVFLGDDDYPANLAATETPPRILYVRGTLQKEENQRILAIVGSRQCTAYGKKVAERMAYDLAQAGWTVVSGLARGIDGAAHKGALQAGGRTIAVLANGLSTVYPPEHKELAGQIKDSGALVTEFQMRTDPLAVLFPTRNRIISGLSRAVVIVEANPKSGALITARLALEQGREVFAVPGPVDNLASAGTLQLLRDGVRLVRNARDLLEDLQGISPLVAADETSPAQEETPAAPPPNLNAEEQRIWDFLAEQPRQLDEMVQELGVSVAQLSGQLMLMEMKRLIRKLPGNRYERC